jgi:hypothetical protein
MGAGGVMDDELGCVGLLEELASLERARVGWLRRQRRLKVERVLALAGGDEVELDPGTAAAGRSDDLGLQSPLSPERGCSWYGPSGCASTRWCPMSFPVGFWVQRSKRLIHSAGHGPPTCSPGMFWLPSPRSRTRMSLRISQTLPRSQRSKPGSMSVSMCSRSSSRNIGRIWSSNTGGRCSCAIVVLLSRA